ncbi:MAG: FAD-dependent oxidoreductase [Candidatus Nanohaloarchaea archaeon]|nr:FAD-dependent oxidoreductase [Candidatus Nanohaloarchaea archaeon]
MLPRVVVLGAGVAGYPAIKQLERAPVEVTVVEPSDYFQFKPALYHVLEGASPDSTGFRLGPQLGKETAWIQERVQDIRPEARTVETESQQVGYDYLIVALGGETPRVLPDDETVLRFETWQDAQRIHDRATSVERVGVVGGGIKGIETAFKLEYMEDVDVTVFEAGERITPQLRADNAERVEQELRGRGIDVRTETRVEDVDAGTVVTEEGDAAEFGLVLEMTGVRPAEPVRTCFDGPLTVDRRLSSPDHDRVFGAGDAIELTEGERTNRAYYATIEGQVAAQNVLHAIHDEELELYRPPDAPYLVSFGGRHGLYQGRRVSFTGVLPYLMERFGVEKRFLWMYRYVPWWRHRPTLF